MRFQDQYSILKKSIDLLTLKTNTIQSAAGTRIKINDVNKLNEAITSLEDFSYLKKEVEVIKNYNILNTLNTDAITMNSDTFNVFNRDVNNLKNKINSNLLILESNFVYTEKNTLCIKLVEHDSLKDLAAELETIDKIIMQVLTHKDINTNYKFSSFDIGSSWVYIILGSELALNLLAGLVWAACVIRKKWKEGSILEETIKGMKVKNESLEDIRKAKKKLEDELISKEADNLLSTFDLDNTNNEYKNRLIYSITELAKLINDGVQVHPSLMAPEESKNLFPDYKNLDFIESKTKLIEEKK